MIVSELIKLLQSCDQEAEVNFQLGPNDNIRKLMAKVALEDDGSVGHDGLGCLKYMCIDYIEQKQLVHAEESYLNIILGQDYYKDSFFEDLVKSAAKGKEATDE